jgi:hypothetical protein
MADVLTTQVVLNGSRNLVVNLNDVSDGSGLAGITVVDATSAAFAVGGQPPGVHLKIKRIVYNVFGMAVLLQWQATTPVDIISLSGFGTLDWGRRIMALPNPNPAGATGSIILTGSWPTTFAPPAGFFIGLEMIKGVPQY